MRLADNCGPHVCLACAGKPIALEERVMIWNIPARLFERGVRAHATWLPVVAAASLSGSALGGGSGNTLPTTSNDFFQPGTPALGAGLPGPFTPVVDAMSCAACHAGYGPQDPFVMVEEFQTWTASMMGQSARDPLFYAGLTIANQDASGAGE